MGLDVDFDCWHGAYSAFMRWREKLAEVAGLPPLELMEGFHHPEDLFGLVSRLRMDAQSWSELEQCYGWQIAALDARLPIRWSCLKRDILYVLLSHSDCDGSILKRQCLPLAKRLEELIPLLPDEDDGGHIGNWREKTQTFVDGLRRADAAGKSVRFH